MNLKILGVLLALLTGVFPLSAQTTYRSIPMDCGGWFSGFAMHSSGRLYGFGDVFGMWRSDDAGQSWQYLQGDFTSLETFINGCAVATTNADRVVFVNGASPTNSRVYTSIDGGGSWVLQLADIISRRDRGATPIIYHPGNDDELWLATKRTGQTGSLWRSTDGGANWSKMGGNTFNSVVATTIYIRPEFPDQIWVGAVGGLYVSANRGVSFTRVWSNAGGVAPLFNATPTVTAIARRADGVGYMATNTKGWRITATDYNNPATYNATATVASWDGWGPNNATVLADGSFLSDSANNNTARSIDGGLTWNNLNMQLVTPPRPAWVNDDALGTPDSAREVIVQDPTNPNRWFMTGGLSPVITSDFGGTWQYPPLTSGIAGVPTYKIRFPRSAPDIALIPGSDHGAFTVIDGGRSGGVLSASRSSVTEQQTYHDVMSSDDGQTLIAAGVNQSSSTDDTTFIIRSVNGGATWTKLNLTASGLPPSYEGITRAISAPGSTTDFLVLLGYTDTAGKPNNPSLYRTINGGLSFTKANGIPDGVNTGMRYHHGGSWLETDGVNTNTRYLTLRADNVLSARGFWRSTDGGSNWAMTSSQPYGTESYISCMSVDRATAGRVWVATESSGLRRSNNGGDSWSIVGDFTAAKAIDAAYGRIAVYGKRPGDTWFKIYYSPDNGVTWSEKSGPGYRFGNLSSLSVDPNRAGQIWVAGISVTVIDPPSALDPVLAGTASGSAPFAGDAANAADKAYDANTATFFAPATNGGFAQLDLGANQSARATSLRFFPRPGFEGRMNGGRFEASANGSAWTTLHTLSASPAAGWQTVTINDTAFYRYFRYIHPTGLADVAEIEFNGLAATAPVILNQPLPTLSGIVGQAVAYTVTASGTPAPTFAITSGTLPAGLSLNSTTGVISGTPSAVGSGSLTLQAANLQGSTTATLTLNVIIGPRLTASAPAYTQLANTTGNAPITLTNTGDAPLSWSATLPSVEGNYTLADSTTAGSGVTYAWLDAVTGGTRVSSLEGTSVYYPVENIPFPAGFSFPYYGGNYTSFNLAAQGWLSVGAPDAFGRLYLDNLNTVPPPTPDFAPANMIAPLWNKTFATGSANAGIYYKQTDADTFVITWRDVQYDANATQRATFQAILSRSGELRFQYQANTMGTSNPAGYAIYIANTDASLSTVFSNNTASATAGKALRFTPPASWLSSATPTSGTLAAGASITLDATINTTGLTTGQTLSANLIFTSNDSLNPTLTLPFNLTVGAASSPPVITSGLTATGTVGSAFSYDLQATNNPTSWSQVSGSLPAGLTLNASTGRISGTPSVAGGFTAGFTATNNFGTSTEQSVTLSIVAAPTSLAYESFTYPAGTLANQNGGTGWSTAWSAATNNINATGLTYTAGANTLVTSGGRAVTNGTQNSFRTLSTAYTSGTYWFGFLAKSSSPGSSYGGLSLFDGAGTERVFFGQPNATSDWGIADGTVTPNNTGTQALIVVRVVLGAGDDTATLWVNPSLASTPSDASAASTRTAEMSFDRIRIASGMPFDFDEIRFGNSFSSVAPMAAPVITAGQSTTGTVNTAFTYQLLASNTPTTYTLAGGSLPTGVSLDTSTGALSGTPLVAGLYTPAFTATNTTGTSPAVLVTISIGNTPTSLAYESFTYPAGTGTLANQNGGTGWVTAWSAATNDINAIGLTYTAGANTLVTSAGRAVTDASQNSFRTLPAAYTSGTYWFSFLAKSSSPGSSYGGLSLFSGAGTERVFFGQPNLTSNWGIAGGTVTPNNTGTQAFIVVRVVLNSGGNDSATLWVNPSLASTPSDASAASTHTAEMGFDRIRIASGSSFDFDEIRFGQTYSSVAPVVYIPTGLESFRATAVLASDGSEDLLTPAGDGVANLLKYAFNMLGSGTGQAATLVIPNVSALTPDGEAGLPFASIGTGGDSGKLQLTYIRRKAASNSGITYAVEFTDDLAMTDPWAVNPSATEITTSIDTTFERVTVTDSATPTRRFVRVRVSSF